MSTKVEKRVLVNVPVSVAYNQWTQFEEFPHFMGGVKSVKQLSDDRLEWIAEIGGVRRQWKARIVEQVPDRRIAWAATEGATNAGSVTFEDLGGGQTSVQLSLEYEPEGIVEKVGDKLNFVERQAESDLDRFKAFIEDEGYATGAWRGAVNEGTDRGTPGVDEAAASRGDSGKAGVSGKVIAGAGLAAAAVAGAAVAAGRQDTDAVPVPQRGDAPNLVPPTGTTGSVFPGESVPEEPARVTGNGLDRANAGLFDQTNGLVDTNGESDGSALGDTASAVERERGTEKGPGPVPPMGGTSGLH